MHADIGAIGQAQSAFPVRLGIGLVLLDANLVRRARIGDTDFARPVFFLPRQRVVHGFRIDSVGGRDTADAAEAVDRDHVAAVIGQRNALRGGEIAAGVTGMTAGIAVAAVEDDVCRLPLDQAALTVQRARADRRILLVERRQVGELIVLDVAVRIAQAEIELERVVGLVVTVEAGDVHGRFAVIVIFRRRAVHDVVGLVAEQIGVQTAPHRRVAAVVDIDDLQAVVAVRVGDVVAVGEVVQTHRVAGVRGGGAGVGRGGVGAIRVLVFGCQALAGIGVDVQLRCLGVQDAGVEAELAAIVIIQSQAEVVGLRIVAVVFGVGAQAQRVQLVLLDGIKLAAAVVEAGVGRAGRCEPAPAGPLVFGVDTDFAVPLGLIGVEGFGIQAQRVGNVPLHGGIDAGALAFGRLVEADMAFVRHEFVCRLAVGVLVAVHEGQAARGVVAVGGKGRRSKRPAFAGLARPAGIAVHAVIFVGRRRVGIGDREQGAEIAVAPRRQEVCGRFPFLGLVAMRAFDGARQGQALLEVERLVGLQVDRTGDTGAQLRRRGRLEDVGARHQL